MRIEIESKYKVGDTIYTVLWPCVYKMTIKKLQLYGLGGTIALALTEDFKIDHDNSDLRVRYFGEIESFNLLTLETKKQGESNFNEWEGIYTDRKEAIEECKRKMIKSTQNEIEARKKDVAQAEKELQMAKERLERKEKDATHIQKTLKANEAEIDKWVEG